MTVVERVLSWFRRSYTCLIWPAHLCHCPTVSFLGDTDFITQMFLESSMFSLHFLHLRFTMTTALFTAVASSSPCPDFSACQLLRLWVSGRARGNEVRVAKQQWGTMNTFVQICSTVSETQNFWKRWRRRTILNSRVLLNVTVQMGHNVWKEQYCVWREKQELLVLRLQFKLCFSTIIQLE